LHPPKTATFGALKAANWRSRSIKAELRENLISALQAKTPIFPSVLGYEDTVLPQLKAALLARHNILLLGLRGQAKTRLARAMVELLDEWMPAVAHTPLNDDPFRPISYEARQLLETHGDDTPITWIHRSERYTEKLATPDVTVADLIGDLDPIKAANLKLDYSDERVIHFGLIPRANRNIFVLNELPDLQARIQVALFNILQEGDIQIRGFKLRLTPDIQFVFTANPEDYTNRGSIVTPLKDRIESQILTHYPKSLDIAQRITQQEARLEEEQGKRVHVPSLLKNLVEQVAFEARDSELIDEKSGVSARLSISAFEQLVAAVELRLLETGEKTGYARIADLFSILPAITGKVELVYEGEQEGPANVAHSLISQAIRTQFKQLFPDPERYKKRKDESPYLPVQAWFEEGNTVDILRDARLTDYRAALDAVGGLKAFVQQHTDRLTTEEDYLMREFVLHGLAETSQLSKQQLVHGLTFKDMLGGLFGNIRMDEDSEEGEDED